MPETAGGWRGLRSAMSDMGGGRCMRGLGFNERDMDGPNEFAGGKVESIESRGIIAVPHKHAAKRFGGEFVHVAVLQAV
jgi:hypothetical protein